MTTDPTDGDGPPRFDGETFGSVEFLLFDSLVHHLMEKGILTKNDALSVVQTAARVVQGRIYESGVGKKELVAALSMLERTYGSFEALRDRSRPSGLDAHNVHPLRTPLHGDRPNFPTEDD